MSPSVIHRLVDQARANLPEDLRRKPWSCPGLNHGTSILGDTQSLDCYLAAYGHMHWHKLEYTFTEFFKRCKNRPDIQQGYELLDWGCGQGLASLAFLDFLSRRQASPRPTRLTLVEPSAAALQRACSFLRAHVADLPPLRLCKRWLPTRSAEPQEISAKDVSAICPTLVHLFSNVLDMNALDLKRLATFLASLPACHYILAVGPCHSTDRIEVFSSYFHLQSQDILVECRENVFDHLDNAYAYGCRIMAFRIDSRTPAPTLRPYAFYPPAQYCCGYRLDMLAYRDFSLVTGLEAPCAFDVLAPFDLAACACQDAHPLLAVLHNIVCRGLPARASPFLETVCRTAFGLTKMNEAQGAITFQQIKALSSEKQREMLARTPLAVARVQLVVLQALLIGELTLQPTWHVLALEQDVPCCALALRELARMFNTLAAMTQAYAKLRFPHIELVVISALASSPLHLSARVLPSLDDDLRQKTYDLILDVAVGEFCDPETVSFAGLALRGRCWFNIRSTARVQAHRSMLTTERLRYQGLMRMVDGHNVLPMPEQTTRLRYFLRLLFRKKDFRPGQREILHRTLRLESVIGLLPTGGGKSLTYQLAALLQPGVTLVVDPLRSLMHDQYMSLRKLGIDCCSYVNSLLDPVENKARLDQLALSRHLIFFITPERMNIHDFRQYLRDMACTGVYFAYGVVDEVHCVSEWGHDFRFSYLHLGRNLYNHVLPKARKGSEAHITLIGLTATASFDVLADVERELSGNRSFPLPPEAIVRYENTNRLELQYRVLKINTDGCSSKWDVYRRKALLAQRLVHTDLAAALRQLQQPSNIARIKQRYMERENITDAGQRQAVTQANLAVNVEDNWYTDAGQAAIVFCPHARGQLGVHDSGERNQRPGIASYLRQALHCDVSTFSGDASDMSAGDARADIQARAAQQQEDFIGNKTGIMVATKAFGMGIDKANVRFTLNMNHSGSLEAFVQEAGRAGRDGKMALAVILYSDWRDADAQAETVYGVDYDVHRYFHERTFLGLRQENVVMHYLMAYQTVYREAGGDKSVPGPAVMGFMRLFHGLHSGEESVFFLPYAAPSKDFTNLNAYLRQQCPRQRDDHATISADQYKAAIARAMYRMCCIGLIDDFTEDHHAKMFRIVLIKKEDGAYYRELEQVLTKYYCQERAAAEAARARTHRGTTEIQKCLGFLSDFVYAKIAMKRLRAIQDMETFCHLATSGSDWLETNEALKDFLYYYFTSKFARQACIAPNGEDFSLTTDTAQGKNCSFAIVRKYVHVIDDDMNAEGSPKDNIKHLQGAVRLLRRALTDANPALDMLNVFCLLYLNAAKDAVLRAELQRSYHNGYSEFYRRCDNPATFYADMAWFRHELGPDGRNVADAESLRLLDAWTLSAEAALHTEKVGIIIQRFLKT